MKSEYDFQEKNKKYCLETFFQIKIILEKTCYFPGENIAGKIKIMPSDLVKKSLLLNQIIGNATLEESYAYKINQNSSLVSEENILFKYPMEIGKFDGDKIINGMEVSFKFPVPQNSYPSCIIDNNSYVRHVLIFDFPNIEAKKSILIIVKNNQYFTSFNELFKAPVEASIKTSKHKYAIFYMGEVSANIKLFKNAFSYDEAIPFIIDIDCSNLTIRIQKVYISIILLIKKNNKSDHKICASQAEKKIMEKTISLLEDKKTFHIEDIIQLPGGNPNDIYKKLDMDESAYSKKYKNINLYPSCYKGLISCEYYIRIMLETDTLFSTNEYANIQVDFYEDDKKNEDTDKNEDKDKDKDKKEEIENINKFNNNITPMGINYEKPLHSHSMKKKDEKGKEINKNKTFNNEKKQDNKNNININVNQSNNKKEINIINNVMQTAQGEVNDGFDAPPPIINFDNKNK